MPIKNFTFTEAQQQTEIKYKETPGFELINDKVLYELPNEGIKFLVHLYNAILRLKYWPLQLKLGQIILVQKPDKPPHEVTSYQPISLLPIISKILEKLLTARLKNNNILDELLPDHQFSCRRYHSTIQQCHRVIIIIIIILNRTLDAKEFCPMVFLDIKQAFNKVWHRGLLYKIKQNLPS